MLNYEEMKKKIIKDNMNKVFLEYKNPDFQKKIKKYAEKFGIEKSKLENGIKANDEIVISIFAKDPSKQNFYEKVAAEYIKKIKGVNNFVNLPNGGKNALFIDKDMVRKKKDYHGLVPSKSLDFKWTFSVRNIKYYAFHKYIKESGGAQDNQFNDVLKSIDFARNIDANLDHKILFICDGEYFTQTKMIQLKNAASNKNHEVLKINDLEKYLNM